MYLNEISKSVKQIIAVQVPMCLLSPSALFHCSRILAAARCVRGARFSS